MAFSWERVALIAGNTLREAARQKLFHFFGLLAAALMAGAVGFRDFNFGAPELKFLADFGLGAMAFFGAVLTITAMAQLFFSEIEHRTVQTLLAKPVWRAEFIIGKYLGVIVAVGGFCALLTGLLAVLLWSRESALMAQFPEAFTSGRSIDFMAVAAAGGLQWLKLAVLAAFTLLVATYAQTQLFTMATGFIVLVICQLQYLAHDVYARAGSLVMKGIAGGIGWLFPNFQLFALADALGAEGALNGAQVARVLIYGMGYVIALTGLAIFSFRRREI